MSYGTDYLDYICSETPGVTLYLESTYAGMTDPIAFPIYTGSNGISTGVQYPPGYSIPITTTSDTTSTASTSSPISISTTSVVGTTHTSASSSSGASSSNSALSPGAKAGTGIGAVVVGLLLIAILLYHLRRRGAQNLYNNTSVPQSSEPSQKPELPTVQKQLTSVPFVPATTELPTNPNTRSRRPNNPQQQAETYAGPQLAVDIDHDKSGPQVPELEATMVPGQTPAASNAATNAPPLSISNEGVVLANIPYDKV